MTELRQFRRAAQARRPTANDGDAFAGFLGRCFEDGDLFLGNVVRGVALQPPDFNRVALAVEHHARAFAQHAGWTDARTTRAQNIRREDGSRRAGEIAGGNFFDERRDVNSRRAGLNARRIKAEQTAVGFNDGFLWRVTRLEIGHAGRRRFRSEYWTDWHKKFLRPVRS